MKTLYNEMPKIPMPISSDMLAPYPISQLYDHIERVIKHEINQMILKNHGRRANKKDYETFYKKIIDNINLNVTNYDLGIYEE